MKQSGKEVFFTANDVKYCAEFVRAQKADALRIFVNDGPNINAI